MNFEQTTEFKRDFKDLKKKYKSLTEDLENFYRVVSTIPSGNGKHFHIITESKCLRIIKARFFCKYLKNSSLRVIYAYCKEKQTIEFVEIYFKGNDEVENMDRIKKHLKRKGDRIFVI